MEIYSDYTYNLYKSSFHALGFIHKGTILKAIHHFNTCLEIGMTAATNGNY